jgi:hypothetical protein
MCDRFLKLKVYSLSEHSAVPGSFRDPAGHLFTIDGTLYRQINDSGAEDYNQLMTCGLYNKLCEAGLLIEHVEVDRTQVQAPGAFKVIKPQPVRYISYPYEWCFSQLRDAALATLKIQQTALHFGMSLKDASAYNMQFHLGKPVLIDTLSFERYHVGSPWPAYRQFCQHFLAPLLLAQYRDMRLTRLLRTYIDGIPLDLASHLLPWHSWLRYPTLAHLHLHARAQQRYAGRGRATQRAPTVSALGMQAMIDGLYSFVSKLQRRRANTEWGVYYSDTNYSANAMSDKTNRVEEFLQSSAAPGQILVDLGANNGQFSRLGLDHGYMVIAQDMDEMAVELSYQQMRDAKDTQFLPLVQDLTNPSPALGWAHEERLSMLQRGPADMVMALALIHHLAISNNVPLENCANFFARQGHRLIIEFVPKSDSQVQRLLSSREDVFPDYGQQAFEAAFAHHFTLLRRETITDSDRTLYLFQTNEQPLKPV